MATEKKGKSVQEVLLNAKEVQDPGWVTPDPEFTTAPAAPADPVSKSVDDIMKELGLESAEATQAPEITMPERPKKAATKSADKPKKEPKVKKEKEPKAPKAPRIPIDAPIPAVQFNGLTLGVYGNILEELEEPDANGYKYAEVKLERYNATAHESFRAKNGNMVLLYPQGGGVYLVAAKKPTGEIEPVIEVTNRGRGCLRCRQLATKLMLAYQEKQDEEMIDPQEYANLVSKITLLNVANSVAEANKQEEQVPVEA